jgi:hypothetical protein
LLAVRPQSKVGVTQVEQLPVAMPRTIRAIDLLLHSACPADSRKQALDLLLAVGAVECHVGPWDTDPMLPQLLRDVVIITTRLAGRTWPPTRTDAAAALTALHATVQPPPLPELDRILAGVLSDHFGLAKPRRQPGQGSVASTAIPGSCATIVVPALADREESAEAAVPVSAGRWAANQRRVSISSARASVTAGDAGMWV